MTVELNVRINLDNAAFADPHEATRCLRKVAEEVAELPGPVNATGIIRDSNGNSVGEWHIIP